MNEFELIAKTDARAAGEQTVVTGAGDDCAVLDLGLPEKLFLFKTDAVVEGVHFTRKRRRKKSGARRSRALSDIAAMAGTPAAALVTIGLPEKFDAGICGKIYAA
jgi:thiamine-monophosphate kinase